MSVPPKLAYTFVDDMKVTTPVSSPQDFIRMLGFAWVAALQEDKVVAESCIAKVGGSIAAGLVSDDTCGSSVYVGSRFSSCSFLFRTLLSSRGCSWSVLGSSEMEYAVKGTENHSRRKRRMISNFLWLGKWERWHASSGSISWPSRRRDRIFRSTRPSYLWSEYDVFLIVGVSSLPVAGQVNTRSAH